MCGIVGCVGKIWKNEEDAFKLMLQFDTTRGPHSTGVLSVRTNHKNWGYLKSVGTPWELMSCKGWAGLINPAHRLLLGHNRWATAGEINNDNAHPFHHGKFVGVHNGTLRGQHRLKDYKKFDVDSENIYYNMDEEGVEETIKKLNGAFALVWYNIEEGVVQMCRNKERPLYLCKSEEGKTYFWASEPWMLKVALGKCGIKHTEPVELEEGKLLTLEVPETLDLSEHAAYLPKIKKVELYDATTHYSSNNWSYNTYSNKNDRDGVKSNIVPFIRPAVGSKQLRAYCGNSVFFSVIGSRSLGNMDYILCEVEDETSPEIRIFVNQKTKLGRLLLSSNKYFRAKVKGSTAKEKYGNYLTVDHRTIEEVEDTPDVIKQLELISQRDESNEGVISEEDKKIMLPANNGKMVPLDKWFKATERGCSWCSDFPRVADADALTWFAEDQFLCPSCSKDPSVMQYIQ